ncbi:MAG: DUF4399 domain-containing protein [Egibacteraceae bacterium]
MRRLLPVLLIALLALALAACDGGSDVDNLVDDVEDVTPDDLAAGDDDGSDDASDAEYDLADQPDDAQPEFVTPANGDTVSSPVTVELSATGVTIEAAGDPAIGEAHYHVGVDTGCVEEGEVVPGPGEEAEADGYFHLGDGSDSTELELEAGTYELCLQLADGAHRAFGGSDEITITVE